MVGLLFRAYSIYLSAFVEELELGVHMDVATVFVFAWVFAAPVFGILWLTSMGRQRSLRRQILEANESNAAEIARVQKANSDQLEQLRSKSLATIEQVRNIAKKAVDDVNRRYSGIIDQEVEIAMLKDQAEKIAKKIEGLRSEYAEKKKILDRVKEQVAIYDERLSFAELGVYEPHFEFNDSEIYKEKIKEVRDKQKAFVSAKTATICPANWTLDGSRSKGQAMINRQTRLTLRAFNNECEAAIANTRWNNVVAMEKRILNAAKQIDSANSSVQVKLNEEYIALKLDELHLTHEYREQLKIEKDERAERARLAREEQKLVAEAQAAEAEERKFQEMLDQARREAGVDEARIAELESALAAAHEKAERAQAMAEKTKSGYVYIISNVGSFGDDVVKIGLTRRLDPDDRVKELGDASVPFTFDTHAMIYSEEAPALEAALHNEFADRRINMSNMRKEFFRVSLREVEDAVHRLAPDAQFFKDREAQEWHETLSRRKEMLATLDSETEQFPASI